MSALERKMHTPTLEAIARIITTLDVSWPEFFQEFERHLKKRNDR